MVMWGAYAEGVSAGRTSRTGPSHISKTVLSTVNLGPLGGTAAAHIGARVGKSGAVASPSAGETGLDRP